MINKINSVHDIISLNIIDMIYEDSQSWHDSQNVQKFGKLVFFFFLSI